MELFFSIFEGLILAAGPFGVFARMALPSDTGRTGNLLFRGFTSSDNSVDIIDGPINITFSSAGGGSSNVKIQNFEIAFGSGDGLSLTSSYGMGFTPGSCVVTTTNRTAIVNIDQWMGNPPVLSYDRKTMMFNTYSSGTSADAGKRYGNLIIGGKQHKICSYPNYTSGYMVRNTILGGSRNCLIQDTGGNVEISSPVFSTKDNLITASRCSCMTHGTKRSTIISSNRIAMVRSFGSSVISSKFSNMGLQSTPYVAFFNTIIASNYNMIGYEYEYGYGYRTNSVQYNILSGRDNSIRGIYELYSFSEANKNRFNLILGKQNTIYGVRKNGSLYTGWGSQYNFISGAFNFINGKRNSIFSSRTSQILDIATSQNTENKQEDNVIISSLGSLMKNCPNNSYPYNYELFMNSIISSENVYQRNYNYYSSYKNSIISSFSGAQYGYCNTMISSSGMSMYNSKNSVIMSSESTGSFLDFKMCKANCSVLISSRQSKVNSPNSAVISSATSSVYGSKGRPIVVISSADSCIRSGESSTILSSAKSNICLAFGSTIISSRNSNICSALFTGGLTASSIIGSHCSGVSESLGNTIVASCFGCIVSSPNSSILGGTCNCIQFGNSSTIIGGRCNRICCSNYSSIIGGNSMFLTQSNTTAVQNIFVKSCIFVGRTLTGFTGYAVNGVNTLSICRGIVTCII